MNYILQLHFKKIQRRDDEEAKSNFWTVTGEFIYRHHVEPRVKTVRAERRSISFSVEVHRRYQNSIYITGCIVGEKQIEDYWNVDGEKELSDAWTGFTRFVLLKERPLEGYTWSGERLTRKQTTSRPDDVWPEMWKFMSDAGKKKAKQRWAIEKPEVDNAGQLTGIFYSEPNDEELKLTMEASRGKLDVPMPVWQLTKVRNKKDVIEEAKNKGRKVHFASLMDLCHLKNSELGPQFQEYEGRVVLRADIVKDDSGSYAVFTEQGSSASQMTVAKVMDIISRLPGFSGQAADAVSACTQVKMEDAPKKKRKFPNRHVQIFGYVYQSTNGLNHGPVWKTQSFLSKGICTVILWQDYYGKGNLRKSYCSTVGKRFPTYCAIRQWSGLQEHRKRLADLRTTLRQEAARDIRISLLRDIRRELNAKLRMVKGEQLNRLLAGYFDRGKQTLEMQLPDGPSSDRHAWAAAAGEHGREVYRDDNNNVDVQMQRLVRLQHLAQREIEAGWQPLAVKFHDFLNALASAKMGKQPGSDGVVVDMVRALSWSTLLWLYLLFLVRLGGWETERPDAWREVVLTAIPKKSDKVGFRSMRYISLLLVIQKFYIRALQSAVRRERKPHWTNILGYEPGRSTAGVTATLRQVLSKAAEWGVGAFVASADVEGAFDGIKHDDVEKALLHTGVHPGSVCSLLRESSDLKGRIKLLGAPMSPAFLYARGARQGSVEGPDMWNQVLDNALHEPAGRWESEGIGFMLAKDYRKAHKKRRGPSGEAVKDEGRVFHHLCWADDLFAMAGTTNHLTRTLEDMTNAIERLGMRWKEKSLTIVAGPFTEYKPGDVVEIISNSGKRWIWRVVEGMKALGTWLDNRGCSEASMWHRISKANSMLYAKKALFCDPKLPVKRRIDAFHSTCVLAALHGAGEWAYTQSMFQALRIWELGKLRRVLCLRRRPNEGWVDYMKLTGVIVARQLKKHNQQRVQTLAMRRVRIAAWQMVSCPSDAKGRRYWEESTIMGKAI